MFEDDDKANNWPEREQHIFEEKLDREGGVFVEPQHTQVDCNSPDADCATDEYPEDPYAIDNRSGTIDDTTYSMGVELPNAADLHLVPEGGVHQAGRAAPDEEPERDLGELEERDLWRRQRPLIQEDEGDGVKVPGATDEQAQRVLDAMGDESSDNTPDMTQGISATGEPTTAPDHGGFPEREE